jgi:hypothetical protein
VEKGRCLYYPFFFSPPGADTSFAFMSSVIMNPFVPELVGLSPAR